MKKNSTFIAILNEKRGNAGKLKYNYVSMGNTDLLCQKIYLQQHLGKVSQACFKWGLENIF